MKIFTTTVLTAIITGASFSAIAAEPSYVNYNFESSSEALNVGDINRINELQPSASANGVLEPGYLNYNYSGKTRHVPSKAVFDNQTLKPLYNDF